MAIHDTSWAVATATFYGDEAAEIATTLKLGRTLWLIPLLLAFAVLEREPQAKLRVPMFVLLFVAASVAGSLMPLRGGVNAPVGWVSKSLLVVALFCIGTELTRETLGAIRGRVLWQGLLLWAIVVPATLGLSMWLG